MVKKSLVNIVSNETNIVSKKRGRKPKENKNVSQENINVVIEETTNIQAESINVEELLKSHENDEVEENDEVDENEVGEKNIFSLPSTEEEKPIPKKRGRKPKGGKIIQQIVPINNNKETKPNVILHLKCSIKDLQNNSILGSEIESYNFQNQTQLSFNNIVNNSESFLNLNNDNSNNQNRFNNNNVVIDDDYECDDKIDKESDIRDIWKKLKVLEHNLHVNNIYDKKSACFWCTYEFDNPPVYIPKHFIKESYHVYGCFCSPECATAYLMEENIDSSSKFERYHLINHIYSKIYDYKKNIKPAPNPYYMLEKYCGNLSIQEYRALLRNERLFLIVDKPLTRILPELHEDNDDFIINNKIIPSNTYQIKKKLQKKQQTKTNILSERFGLSQQ